MLDLQRAGVKDHGVVTGFLEGVWGWYPDIDRDRWDWVVAELLDSDSWMFLLAYHEGEPAGLAVVSWRLTLYGSREEGRLEAVLVVEERRHEGVGSALMEAVLNAARRRGCRELEVALPMDAEGALSFFKRFEYREEKRLLVWPCAD
ncbi:MAG: GNAT family N-acetyltransferase [Actinomycetota bacterium]